MRLSLSLLLVVVLFVVVWTMEYEWVGVRSKRIFHRFLILSLMSNRIQLIWTKKKRLSQSMKETRKWIDTEKGLENTKKNQVLHFLMYILLPSNLICCCQHIIFKFFWKKEQKLVFIYFSIKCNKLKRKCSAMLCILVRVPISCRSNDNDSRILTLYTIGKGCRMHCFPIRKKN